MKVIFHKKDSPYIRCNTLMLEGSRTIIDPSEGLELIDEESRKRGWKRCILTHYHGDHRASYHVARPEKTYAHELDAGAISSFKEFKRKTGFDREKIGEMMFQYLVTAYNLAEIGGLTPVKGGDVIETGDEEIEIIHTPGHTPGHICLYFRKEDTLYLSDIDLSDFGPWYGNEAADLGSFIASIDKLIDFDAGTFISGHIEGYIPKKEARERLKRYKNIISERDERIISSLKEKPQTLGELARKGIVYIQKTLNKNPHFIFFEKMMLGKHLERLIGKNVVFQEGDKFLLK